MVELLVRLAISMGVVMGVMALAARMVRRRQGGARPGRRAGAGRRSAGTGLWAGAGAARRQRPKPPFTVLHRQALAKGAWVAMVESEGKHLLLGVTERSVNVLSETAPAAGHGPGALTPAAAAGIGDGWTGTGRTPVSLEAAPGDGEPTTAWKLSLDSLRERTVRR
jgi:hypothetical protein